MKAYWLIAALFSGLSLAQADSTVTPITTDVWQEAVVSVTDLDTTARFFREIG